MGNSFQWINQFGINYKLIILSLSFILYRLIPVKTFHVRINHSVGAEYS